MAVRMSGMVSGLDTESIVKELVKTQQSKLDKIKNNQTTLEWKTDKWKDVNKKIVDFFKTNLSDMRFKSSYNTKTATITDSAVGSVTTTADAVMGNHALIVEKLAQTQSWITDEVARTDGSSDAVTTDTKLTALGASAGSITISTGSLDSATKTDHTFTIDENTTLGNLIDELKKDGLNASYDTTQKRMYISAKNEGTNSSFTITGDSANTGFVTSLQKNATVASDATFKLDGIEYKTQTNTNTINGIKLELTGVSDKDSDGNYKSTTVRVKSDVDSTYKKIKEFVKSYNTLLSDLNTLYDADKAKGYDPLTSDQKESMTDDEITQWNKKITDSLLSGDEYLGNVLDSMRNTIYGIKETGSDGKETGNYVSLSTYGIGTSYDYTEKGKLHIDGDSEDDVTSAKPDALKKALETDPDKVASDLSTIFGKMYASLNTIMTSTSDYKSSQKFYNDKELATQKTQYAEDYTEMEKKLNALEDRYYSQFTAMEKSLQQLQDSSSGISGLTST